MQIPVLASRSPRRQELLRQAGIPFEADSPEVDESCELPADQAVKELSRRKAAAMRKKYPDRFILAADTLVSLDGTVLGKPRNNQDALRMLKLLSGRTHQVFTGVTVVSPQGEFLTEEAGASVTFCEIPEEEMRAYVRSGEPLDKAGAYAIQGRAAVWIPRVEGNVSSVIGLPLSLVRELLLRAGYPWPDSL